MKLFSVILFSLIVGGCSESSPFTAEKPENLLSETKFSRQTGLTGKHGQMQRPCGVTIPKRERGLKVKVQTTE